MTTGYRRFSRDEVERTSREMPEQYAPMTELIEDAPLVRACELCGAGPNGRCDPRGVMHSCPHGCFPG